MKIQKANSTKLSLTQFRQRSKEGKNKTKQAGGFDKDQKEIVGTELKTEEKTQNYVNTVKKIGIGECKLVEQITTLYTNFKKRIVTNNHLK